MKLLDKLTGNTTVKNGMLFTFFSFLNSGVNFILLILIAKYLEPQGYGHVNLFNIAVNLFAYFICLNTTGTIAVNFFRKSILELRKTINAVFSLSVGCYLFLLFIIFLFQDYFEICLNLPLFFQISALTLCFFDVFIKIALEIWRIEEKVFIYGLYSLGKVSLNFILTLVFVICLKQDWYGQIYSYLLVGLLFFIISLFVLIKKNYLTCDKPSKENYCDILSFGIPLIPHNASFWLRQGLDRIIMNIYQSTSIVGLFSFSMNFANIIQIIGSAFNATNSVFIYKNLNSDDELVNEKLKKQTLLMIVIYLIIGIFVCVGCSIFIPLFYPQYKNSIFFLIWQCAGSVCQCVYLLFVNLLFYYKRTKVLMYITFTMSLIHALCSFLFTRYGAEYTAIIGFCSNFIIMVSVFLYSRKIYKII